MNSFKLRLNHVYSAPRQLRELKQLYMLCVRGASGPWVFWVFFLPWLPLKCLSAPGIHSRVTYCSCELFVTAAEPQSLFLQNDNTIQTPVQQTQWKFKLDLFPVCLQKNREWVLVMKSSDQVETVLIFHQVIKDEKHFWLEDSWEQRVLQPWRGLI